MRVLYQDPCLLIAEKPVGMLSEKSPDGTDVISALERQTGGYVGSVHRLDRTTGGIMLFSADPSKTGMLADLIRDNGLRKEYLAVTEGAPDPASGLLEDRLFFDRRQNRSFVVTHAGKGAKSASLSYEVLATADTPKGSRALVRVELYTGRTHQIRVQFGSRKLPLCGDGKYGARDNRAKTAALWSYRLRFRHPVTGNELDLRCPPPWDVYPWSLWKDSEAVGKIR